MNFVFPVLFIIALLVGIATMPLAIYHFFRMTQEVRSRSNWWVNLIPYIAFALPGALTPIGVAHRTKGTQWMLVSGICIAIAAAARFLADQ
jgi:uncharacterized membrane protein YkvI